MIATYEFDAKTQSNTKRMILAPCRPSEPTERFVPRVEIIRNTRPVNKLQKRRHRVCLPGGLCIEASSVEETIQ